ncbi:MAG: TonB C-terminal domain-containing protein [Desulfobulbaceae bacterium]|nr:TonB C-terminal domain-containing protein [Desulfobulbaceae bacterium]
MRRQQRGTYALDGNPYPSLFAAICAHLVVAALIVILPSRAIKPEPEQIVAINLTAIPASVSPKAASGPPPKAEPKPQPPPEPTKIEATPVKEKPQPPPPQPPEKIEAIPVKEKPVPEVVKETPPPQVISLKPQRQVIKKAPPEPPKETTPKKETVKRELDKIRQELMHDQRKQNEAEAKAAEAEAARLTRQLENLQAQSRIMEAREQGLGSGPAPSAAANSALAQQYYARITGQLQSYWKLPDFKDWPPNTLATVAVTIDKSGKILDVQLRKSSGDGTFDRLVRKAVDAASPLPPIPSAMKMERLEFTADYTPGSITGR